MEDQRGARGVADEPIDRQLAVDRPGAATPTDAARCGGRRCKKKNKQKKKRTATHPAKKKKRKQPARLTIRRRRRRRRPTKKRRRTPIERSKKKKRVRRLFRRPLWGVSSVFLFYFFCQRSASFLFCFASDVANFILKKNNFFLETADSVHDVDVLLLFFFLFWLASASAWRRADGWKSASDQRRRSMPL